MLRAPAARRGLGAVRGASGGATTSGVKAMILWTPKQSALFKQSDAHRFIWKNDHVELAHRKGAHHARTARYRSRDRISMITCGPEDASMISPTR